MFQYFIGVLYSPPPCPTVCCALTAVITCSSWPWLPSLPGGLDLSENALTQVPSGSLMRLEHLLWLNLPLGRWRQKQSSALPLRGPGHPSKGSMTCPSPHNASLRVCAWLQVWEPHLRAGAWKLPGSGAAGLGTLAGFRGRGACAARGGRERGGGHKSGQKSGCDGM